MAQAATNREPQPAPPPAHPRGHIEPHVISALLDPGLNIEQVAERCKTTVLELCRWLAEPAIAATVDLIHATVKRRNRLLASNEHTPAILAIVRIIAGFNAEPESVVITGKPEDAESRRRQRECACRAISLLLRLGGDGSRTGASASVRPRSHARGTARLRTAEHAAALREPRAQARGTTQKAAARAAALSALNNYQAAAAALAADDPDLDDELDAELDEQIDDEIDLDPDLDDDNEPDDEFDDDPDPDTQSADQIPPPPSVSPVPSLCSPCSPPNLRVQNSCLTSSPRPP